MNDLYHDTFDLTYTEYLYLTDLSRHEGPASLWLLACACLIVCLFVCLLYNLVCCWMRYVIFHEGPAFVFDWLEPRTKRVVRWEGGPASVKSCRVSLLACLFACLVCSMACRSMRVLFFFTMKNLRLSVCLCVDLSCSKVCCSMHLFTMKGLQISADLLRFTEQHVVIVVVVTVYWSYEWRSAIE